MSVGSSTKNQDTVQKASVSPAHIVTIPPKNDGFINHVSNFFGFGEKPTRQLDEITANKICNIQNRHITIVKAEDGNEKTAADDLTEVFTSICDYVSVKVAGKIQEQNLSLAETLDGIPNYCLPFIEESENLNQIEKVVDWFFNERSTPEDIKGFLNFIKKKANIDLHASFNKNNCISIFQKNSISTEDACKWMMEYKLKIFASHCKQLVNELPNFTNTISEKISHHLEERVRLLLKNMDADPSLFPQIFDNLVKNFLDHTESINNSYKQVKKDSTKKTSDDELSTKFQNSLINESEGLSIKTKTIDEISDNLFHLLFPSLKELNDFVLSIDPPPTFSLLITEAKEDIELILGKKFTDVFATLMQEDEKPFSENSEIPQHYDPIEFVKNFGSHLITKAIPFEIRQGVTLVVDHLSDPDTLQEIIAESLLPTTSLSMLTSAVKQMIVANAKHLAPYYKNKNDFKTELKQIINNELPDLEDVDLINVVIDEIYHELTPIINLLNIDTINDPDPLTNDNTPEDVIELAITTYLTEPKQNHITDAFLLHHQELISNLLMNEQSEKSEQDVLDTLLNILFEEAKDSDSIFNYLAVENKNSFKHLLEPQLKQIYEAFTASKYKYLSSIRSGVSSFCQLPRTDEEKVFFLSNDTLIINLITQKNSAEKNLTKTEEILTELAEKLPNDPSLETKQAFINKYKQELEKIVQFTHDTVWNPLSALITNKITDTNTRKTSINYNVITDMALETGEFGRFVPMIFQNQSLRKGLNETLDSTLSSFRDFSYRSLLKASLPSIKSTLTNKVKGIFNEQDVYIEKTEKERKEKFEKEVTKFSKVAHQVLLYQAAQVSSFRKFAVKQVLGSDHKKIQTVFTGIIKRLTQTKILNERLFSSLLLTTSKAFKSVLENKPLEETSLTKLHKKEVLNLTWKDDGLKYVKVLSFGAYLLYIISYVFKKYLFPAKKSKTVSNVEIHSTKPITEHKITPLNSSNEEIPHTNNAYSSGLEKIKKYAPVIIKDIAEESYQTKIKEKIEVATPFATTVYKFLDLSATTLVKWFGKESIIDNHFQNFSIDEPTNAQIEIIELLTNSISTEELLQFNNNPKIHNWLNEVFLKKRISSLPDIPKDEFIDFLSQLWEKKKELLSNFAITINTSFEEKAKEVYNSKVDLLAEQILNRVLPNINSISDVEYKKAFDDSIVILTSHINAVTNKKLPDSNIYKTTSPTFDTNIKNAKSNLEQVKENLANNVLNIVVGTKKPDLIAEIIQSVHLDELTRNYTDLFKIVKWMVPDTYKSFVDKRIDMLVAASSDYINDLVKKKIKEVVIEKIDSTIETYKAEKTRKAVIAEFANRFIPSYVDTLSNSVLIQDKKLHQDVCKAYLQKEKSADLVIELESLMQKNLKTSYLTIEKHLDLENNFTQFAENTFDAYLTTYFYSNKETVAVLHDLMYADDKEAAYNTFLETIKNDLGMDVMTKTQKSIIKEKIKSIVDSWHPVTEDYKQRNSKIEIDKEELEFIIKDYYASEGSDKDSRYFTLMNELMTKDVLGIPAAIAWFGASKLSSVKNAVSDFILVNISTARTSPLPLIRTLADKVENSAKEIETKNLTSQNKDAEIDLQTEQLINYDEVLTEYANLIFDSIPETIGEGYKSVSRSTLVTNSPKWIRDTLEKKLELLFANKDLIDATILEIFNQFLMLGYQKSGSKKTTLK